LGRSAFFGYSGVDAGLLSLQHPARPPTRLAALNDAFDGDWHYFGRPGFYGGRYNGGSFGPCWTQTPIGPVWNCG
jgi:hypothetical protein